jgi:hypothetical protein
VAHYCCCTAAAVLNMHQLPTTALVLGKLKINTSTLLSSLLVLQSIANQLQLLMTHVKIAELFLLHAVWGPETGLQGPTDPPLHQLLLIEHKAVHLCYCLTPQQLDMLINQMPAASVTAIYAVEV